MQQRSPGTYQVLFVGPSWPTATALTALLAKQGRRMCAAVDEQAAREAIQRSPPDLILLDIGRAGGDGYAFCRRLKADQACDDVPILCVLPQGAPRPEKFFAAGAASFGF
jgi:CheY-like chemotaxis protein